MKILSFAVEPPYPPERATRIRTWNFLSRLARTDDVTLVTWGSALDERRLADLDMFRVIMLERGAWSAGLRARLSRRVRSLAGGEPPWVRAYRECSQPVPDIPGDFDVAIAHDEAAWCLMPQLPFPRAVDRHNVFSVTMDGLIKDRSLGATRRTKWRLERRMWSRFDRNVSEQADGSIVTTSQAAFSLRMLIPEATLHVATNGVDLGPRPLPQAVGPCVSFVGTMDYEPNISAVIWFVREVWPIVRAWVPPAEFRIIGREPAKRVRRLEGSGVRVLGEVDDLTDALEGSRVGVVPLRAGSGIKTKTQELLGFALPVVSTSVGAEGIAFGPNEGLFVRNDPVGFAEAVVHMLRNPLEARVAGLAGREAVRRQFSWETSAAAYRSALELAGSWRMRGVS
jgi:glycosyltransferase involved in cell wall biosynthesis